jgi:hypothetical protein
MTDSPRRRVIHALLRRGLQITEDGVMFVRKR